jgi:hypothetical protein
MAARASSSAPGLFRVDGTRRGVFLHVHPVVVQVDGHGVFRHVGIVDAVAVDFFTRAHLPSCLRFFCRRLANICAPSDSAPARWPAAPGDAPGPFNLGLAALAGDELVGLQLEQQQLARQGAVPERVLLVAADAHALAQLRRAGEHRRFPAHAGLAQALAEVLVEVQQAGFVTQTLAVGGLLITRPFWFWSGRGSKVATSPW